jgi:hypothetical protein
MFDHQGESIAERIPMAPADYVDPVIEVYKQGVDRTLLRENLKLTVEERIRKAQSFHRSIENLRGAASRRPSASAERLEP